MVVYFICIFFIIDVGAYWLYLLTAVTSVFRLDKLFFPL
jgi:hypothetical protein